MIPNYNLQSDPVVGKDASAILVFPTNQAGEFKYICSIPGNQAAGMEGNLTIKEKQTVN